MHFSLALDPGPEWTVAGNDSASGLGTLDISGFAVGDTIDLTGGTWVNNALVVSDGVVGDFDTLAVVGNFLSSDFHYASDNAGGVDITLLPPLRS